MWFLRWIIGGAMAHAAHADQLLVGPWPTRPTLLRPPWKNDIFAILWTIYVIDRQLAAVKLFTTWKRNIVEWPKMHNLQNEIYTFFRVYTSVSLYLVLGALRLGLPSSPIEIYVTIGLGISVSENEIFYTIVLEIFVLENYTWPLPRNDPEGMGGYTSPAWEKLTLSLNISQKFTL